MGCLAYLRLASMRMTMEGLQTSTVQEEVISPVTITTSRKSEIKQLEEEVISMKSRIQDMASILGDLQPWSHRSSQSSEYLHQGRKSPWSPRTPQSPPRNSRSPRRAQTPTQPRPVNFSPPRPCNPRRRTIRCASPTSPKGITSDQVAKIADMKKMKKLESTRKSGKVHKVTEAAKLERERVESFQAQSRELVLKMENEQAGLRAQLESALADVARVGEERDLLMELSNSLRSDLKRAELPSVGNNKQSVPCVIHGATGAPVVHEEASSTNTGLGPASQHARFYAATQQHDELKKLTVHNQRS